MSWLGMFENLERARKHFLVVIPITAYRLFRVLFEKDGVDEEEAPA